jgi:hypothetical protein
MSLLVPPAGYIYLCLIDGNNRCANGEAFLATSGTNFQEALLPIVESAKNDRIL